MSKKSAEMILGILAVALVMVAGFYFVGGNSFNPQQDYPIKTLEADWSVRYNGRDLGTKDLDEIKVETPAVGDKYSLKRALNDEEVPGASIHFRAFQSKVEAYLDDVLIYQQGSDALEKGRMPGRTLVVIPLSDGYRGKTLRIDITACEKGAFTALGPFYLGNQQDLMHDFMSKRQLPHLFGTFLTLFALFQFLLIPYLVIRNRSMVKQFFSALLVLSAGTYMLAFYNLFNVYVTDPEVNTFLEFLSIYGIPTSMCGYLQYVLRGKTGRIYTIFTIIDFLLLGIVLALHFTNIVHISQSLMPMYALCVIEVIPFVSYLIRAHRERALRIRENWLDELAEVLPLNGMVVFALFSFIDMAYYLYAKNVLKDEAEATIILATLGGMILALSQMVSFLMQGVGFLRAESSRQALLEAAHTDQLTGLSNRVKFEQEMKDREEANSLFAIICLHFDVINSGKDSSKVMTLKEGTLRFAKELSASSPENAIVSRIEDDEYTVILDNVYEHEVRDYIAGFIKNINRYNRDNDTGFDVSYGMAVSSDSVETKSAYDIYLLADHRMFEMRHEKDRKRGDQSA